MDTLLSEIEKFCATHRLSEWQFGEMALNDRHFIRQLRDDREPRRKTVERVREFMATYRPAQAAA
jgi:putative IMPACT (imprinted ancient) family translation regulator